MRQATVTEHHAPSMPAAASAVRDNAHVPVQFDS